MGETKVIISFKIDSWNEPQLEKILEQIIKLKTYDLKIEVNK